MLEILIGIAGLAIVGVVYGMALICRASSMQSRAEEWEAALRRAQEAEAAGKKELEEAKAKILEEVKK
jgi:hypothetical protein